MGKKTVDDIRSISVDVLNVADAYQRHISKSLVKAIADEFNQAAFDPLLVGERQDGSLWVIDGQTRLEVAKRLKHAFVSCRVVASSGEQFEADLFLPANKKRSMKRSDKYKAALCAGHKDTVATQKMILKYGFQIGDYSRSWPMLRCVAKVQDAYEAGVLPLCLDAIMSSWPNNTDALSELVMGGLRDFFVHFPDVDIARAKHKWRSLPPNQLLVDAKSTQAASGTRYRAAALCLMYHYNKGLRRNRLEW